MGRIDRTTFLLLVGLASGAVLAAVGIVADGLGGATPRGRETVATVNGRAIALARFEQALALAERDRRQPITMQDRQATLERMIDEELLLQRALELGIHESDRKLRADLVAALIDSVAAQGERKEPDDSALRKFLDENRASFSGATQLRVGEIFVAKVGRDDSHARLLAETVADRLRAGEALEDVRRQLGDAQASSLPDAPLPMAKLADYVGPTASARLLTMSEGEVSEPLGTGDGYRIVMLLERRQAPLVSLESMRTEVLAAYSRQARELEVERYLDELRRSAEIVVINDGASAPAELGARQ